MVVTPALVEGRSKSAVGRDYGVSRRWVITLIQRHLPPTACCGFALDAGTARVVRRRDPGSLTER